MILEDSHDSDPPGGLLGRILGVMHLSHMILEDSHDFGKRGTSTTDKMVDADAVKKICDIYDWDGKGELDLSSSATSCTPWATTPPRRCASALARPMRRARSSPSSTTSSPRWKRP